jgi:hypothetical protein
MELQNVQKKKERERERERVRVKAALNGRAKTTCGIECRIIHLEYTICASIKKAEHNMAHTGGVVILFCFEGVSGVLLGNLNRDREGRERRPKSSCRRRIRSVPLVHRLVAAK